MAFAVPARTAFNNAVPTLNHGYGAGSDTGGVVKIKMLVLISMSTMTRHGKIPHPGLHGHANLLSSLQPSQRAEIPLGESLSWKAVNYFNILDCEPGRSAVWEA